MDWERQFAELTADFSQTLDSEPQKVQEKFLSGSVATKYAILYLLYAVKELPGVHFKFQHQGISIRVWRLSGGELTCAHLNQLKDSGRLTVYLEVDVPDPKTVFCTPQQTQPHISRGQVSPTPERVAYVAQVWRAALMKARSS